MGSSNLLTIYTAWKNHGTFDVEHAPHMLPPRVATCKQVFWSLGPLKSHSTLDHAYSREWKSHDTTAPPSALAGRPGAAGEKSYFTAVGG